jgi:hypothetical protein
VEFESPDPAAATPPGSCPPGGGHRGRASPSTRAGNRYLQVRASSFSPAVPPACHKQRSRAVSSGQPRSLREDRWAGRPSPDLRWGRRPKLHGMQGVRGSNPLSSTPGQRPDPASAAPGSPAPGSRLAATAVEQADPSPTGASHRRCWLASSRGLTF